MRQLQNRSCRWYDPAVQKVNENGEPLRVGVIGCGRMGRLHARVYSEMPSVKLVGIHDSCPETAQAVAESFGCNAFDSPEDLARHVSAATIAVPTACHADLAETCLSRGVSCLIEKPLAKNVEEARRIADAAQRSEATVQVGHIDRFNPVMRAMNRLDIQPRFIEVTRISPMTFR